MLSKVPVAGQMCTTSQQKKDVFIFIRAVEKKTTIIEAEKLVSFTHFSTWIRVFTNIESVLQTHYDGQLI